MCPVIKLDGVLATGKQFDLDITLPEDNRSVIYGVVSDSCHNPVCDAVVKLVEVVNDCGKEERRPVSHTFTDEHGEFVFGPLCANKFYEIVIWVDEVKHCKICTSCKHEGRCLQGIKLECPPCDMHHKNLVINMKTILVKNLVMIFVKNTVIDQKKNHGIKDHVNALINLAVDSLNPTSFYRT